METARTTGRPKKAPHERRSERLSGIRLTTAERVAAEAKAARMGVSLAEFSRRAINGQRMPQPRNRDLDRAIVELNRVGVNLNQIAHAVNSGRGLPHDFPDVLAELRAVLADLAGPPDGS